MIIYMGQATTLIKTAYEKSGKSYTEIHAETGIAGTMISKILNGKQYASLEMLYKIGKSVGVKPEQVAKAWKNDKITEIDAEIEKFLNITKQK